MAMEYGLTEQFCAAPGRDVAAARQVKSKEDILVLIKGSMQRQPCRSLQDSVWLSVCRSNLSDASQARPHSARKVIPANRLNQPAKKGFRMNCEGSVQAEA